MYLSIQLKIWPEKHMKRWIIFILIIGLISCKTTYKAITERDVSFIYNPASSSLHPEYGVYHKNDSISYLMVKLYPSELLFNEANPEGMMLARIKIHYQVYQSLDQLILTDSSTHKLNITRHMANQEVVSYIPIKVPKGFIYSTLIATTDLNRQSIHRTYKLIDKQDYENPQNYIITSATSNTPIIDTYVGEGDQLKIQHSFEKPDSFYIEWHGKAFLKASAPSDMFLKYDTLNMPDTSWYFHSYRDTLTLPKKGLYIVKKNVDDEKGAYISHFLPDYPKTTSAIELIEPLQYIANDQEYQLLLNSENKKLAVDEFWLSKTEHIENARELIRIYYNRVMYANYYFTSYKEGWKTDRGMIYIIYGPPMKIHKSDNTETWIYGLKRSEQLVFKFKRNDENIDPEYFELIRGGGNVTRWQEAVQTWRKGRIFVYGIE